MPSKTRASTRQRAVKPRKSTKNTKREAASKAADPVQLAEKLANKDVVRQHHIAGLARAIDDLDFEYPGIVTFIGSGSHSMLDTLDWLDLMLCFDVAVSVLAPYPRHKCRNFWPDLHKSWIANKTVANVAKQLASGEILLPGVPKTRLRSLRLGGGAA